MGFLRLADLDAVKRIEHESGDWIDVRANLSKRDINRILTTLPQELLNGTGQVTFQAAVGSAEALFAALLVGWSLEVPATVENYLNLDGEPAAWIDQKLFEHFNSLTLSEDERGKPSTSASD